MSLWGYQMLGGFVTAQSDDDLKRDLELIHEPCGTHIWDVQDTDTLEVHVRGALEHLASCTAERQ